MPQGKITHIITGLSTGGAENALYNLLSGGLSNHFNNLIISLIDEGTMGAQIKATGGTVSSLGMRSPPSVLHGLSKLHRVVRDFKPDIIQGWMYHGNIAATIARSFAPGRPMLAWNIRHSLYELGHEKPLTQQVIRANRLFSSIPEVLLYNSNLSRKQHEDFGFASLNSQVVPNGIDVQKFNFSFEVRKAIRTKLGIPPEAQIIGHVARVHPMKDHPTFLRAAASIALRYPRVHFLLIGRNVSLKNNTLARLIPAQMRDRFHLLGERNNVFDLMSAMDIFCQSSWSEAFPNVLGEVMATGIPCVATDVGDSHFIIGKSGIVVQPRNKNALADGLEKLLTIPLDQRHTLGANARARIEANFTLGMIVDQYTELYNTLLAAKSVN